MDYQWLVAREACRKTACCGWIGDAISAGVVGVALVCATAHQFLLGMVFPRVPPLPTAMVLAIWLVVDAVG